MQLTAEQQFWAFWWRHCARISVSRGAADCDDLQQVLRFDGFGGGLRLWFS
jgi:hypothetical protein